MICTLVQLSPGSQSDEDNEAEAMERGGDGLAGGMGDNMHTETGALKDMPRTDMPAFAGIKGAHGYSRYSLTACCQIYFCHPSYRKTTHIWKSLLQTFLSVVIGQNDTGLSLM